MSAWVIGDLSSLELTIIFALITIGIAGYVEINVSIILSFIVILCTLIVFVLKKSHILSFYNILKLDNPEALKSNKIKPKLKPKPSENEKSKTDLQVENKPKPDIKKIDEKQIINKTKTKQKQ